MIWAIKKDLFCFIRFYFPEFSIWIFFLGGGGAEGGSRGKQRWDIDNLETEFSFIMQVATSYI